MRISDHLTCLLRNLYVGQEAIIKTLYRITEWLKIKKGIWRGCLLSTCLFNLYAEHIMRKARLDELQAGIKIGGRNLNNLRYADYTTLMAECKEDLKSLENQLNTKYWKTLRSWYPAPAGRSQPCPRPGPAGGATRGAMAAQAQEGLEELYHVEGQERRR